MTITRKSMLPLLITCTCVVAQNVAARSQANSTASTAHFEVATIKPSSPNSSNSSPGAMGHRVTMYGTTVLFLIGFAYDLHDDQIIGSPSWSSSEKFDIDAVSGIPGDPSLDQIKMMLRGLLAERFQLTAQSENRPHAAYALSLAKNGPKLAESSEPVDSKPGLFMQPGFPKVAAMKGVNLSMSDFARLLQSGILDRPVVDHTGLAGKYDFLLRWTPDDSQFRQVGLRLPPPSESSDAPSLYTAIQDQLGLKLTAEKDALVPVLLIQHLSRPSPN
jgi:uncharacterized protein (TIGR03435 family)